jgi:predicted component of type VI protein secretion system
VEVKLIVVGGKHPGQVIPVPGPEFLIGRADECQLRPQSDRVSRRHCAIVQEDGLVVVRDCGSKNGTFVNGQRLTGEHQLQPGDKLQVGPLEFEVQLSVNVSGKRKPKVHNVQEAAARLAETATGEDVDISGWLDDEDLNQPEDPASDTTALPAAPAAKAPAKPAPEPAAPANKDAAKKPTAPVQAPNFGQKAKAESSRAAAADMLKQFLQHRP